MLEFHEYRISKVQLYPDDKVMDILVYKKPKNNKHKNTRKSARNLRALFFLPFPTLPIAYLLQIDTQWIFFGGTRNLQPLL